MIFLPDSIDLILRGEKTQTRRPHRDGDRASTTTLGTHLRVFRGNNGGRLHWERGRTYSICPGRGKKAVGRIRLTGIRLEAPCGICDADVYAEGLRWDSTFGVWRYWSTGIVQPPHDHAAAYIALLRTMYPRLDPSEPMWVLEFEVER